VSLTPLIHLEAELRGLKEGDTVALGDADRHHLRAVLRLPAGAEVEVSDGAGGHAPAVLGEGEGVVLVADASFTPPPRPRLHVVQALPKGRKMDDVVRAGVELGLDRLVPVAAARSVTRLEGARAAKAVDRWRAVARSASEQSRRRHRPEITGIVGTHDLHPTGVWLLAQPSAATGLPAALERALSEAEAEEITLAVGPEGGWSPEEGRQLAARGAVPVHLGASVLRTEHAAAAGLAAIGALSGRWD
jgi:16S rRNA (uracil1498-N3)-methyltransferase